MKNHGNHRHDSKRYGEIFRHAVCRIHGKRGSSASFVYADLFCSGNCHYWLLVLISGLYFVKSIVIPVREVIAAAKRFATGDMSTRIQKKSDDEMGDLTDVINYMADEITASEKMKNDFISSVSHELRTPLTAIKGWSETLETLGDDPEDCEMMQRGLTRHQRRDGAPLLHGGGAFWISRGFKAEG